MTCTIEIPLHERGVLGAGEVTFTVGCLPEQARKSDFTDEQ